MPVNAKNNQERLWLAIKARKIGSVPISSEADFEPSEQEVKALSTAIERLRGSLIAWIKRHHSELLKK